MSLRGDRSRHRRSRADQRRTAGAAPFARLALGASCLLVAGGGAAFPSYAAPGASRFDLRLGAQYHARTWDTVPGRESATQFLAPVDASWRGRGILLSAGGDFARSQSDRPGDPTAVVSPGEVRAALQVAAGRDRARIGIGLRSALSTAGLGAAEARTADLLDEVALGFPRAQHPGGTRLLVQAVVQPLRRSGLTLQGGAGWERRGPYEVLSDGRRLDPGDPWKLAAGLTAGRGSVTGDLGVRWEQGSRSVLDGRYAFREGNGMVVEASLRRQYDRGRISLSGAVAGRERGSVDPGAPLEDGSLRGGNALHLVLSAVRSSARGELGLSLGLLGVRGYPGDLGHAGAVEPGLSWLRGFAGGRLGLDLRGVIGRCRHDRSLRGVDVALTWQGAWRR